MKKREYQTEIMRVWGEDISRAEALVGKAERLDETDDVGDWYLVKLDPEDFLDLCAGKWHKDA